MYYNTTSEKGSSLKRSRTRTRTQEEKIFSFFLTYGEPLSPSMILDKMNLKDNPLIKLFSRVNLINETDLKLFHKGTRDIKEITVLVDKESDSLILDKCVQDLDEYYSLNENYSKDEHFTLVENEYLKTPPLEDDYVRYGLYKEFLKNTSVLDFGCGKGGFLKLLKENNISNDLTGLELNQTNNKNINLEGINCLFDLNNSELKFDFIFLNHVLEHLENPISVLTDLLSRLNNKGKIIIEIPHGNDFLIKKSGLVSFKDFYLLGQQFFFVFFFLFL